MKNESGNDLNLVVERLFRSLSGQLTATLTRIFGTSNIDLAESVVQDAFLKACEVWPYKGIPQNPAGWVTTVARNLALDSLRKQRRFSKIAPQIALQYEAQIDQSLANGDLDDRILIDDQLKMMLLICNPKLSRKAQVSLTLKISGGFSVGEIARAFLTNEETIRKMITRSKRSLQTVERPFEWPAKSDFRDRIDAILEVLYLIFNEGYLAYEGQSAVRTDLCEEAIRLTRLFLNGTRSLPKEPTINALLALMLLHSARISARIDASGNLVLLEDQDRTLWNRDKINMGLRFLRESISGNEISAFHYEAQIAAAHAVSESYADTDWNRIVNHYDALFKMTQNPVVALNRAVVFSNLHGVDAGLLELNKIADDKRLKDYYLLPATYADFYRRLGENAKAEKYFQKALALVRNESEQTFIKQRILECGN